MFYAIGGYFLRAARIIFRLLTFQLTRIRSSRASIHARYGFGARIGAGSAVTDDINIGSYSYINSGSTVESCAIGSYCSISSDVQSTPGSIISVAYPQAPHSAAPIEISDCEFSSTMTA